MPSASLLSTAQIETIVHLIKEVPSSQGLSTAQIEAIVHLMLLVDGWWWLMASGSSSESDATPATTVSGRGAMQGAYW